MRAARAVLLGAGLVAGCTGSGSDEVTGAGTAATTVTTAAGSPSGDGSPTSTPTTSQGGAAGQAATADGASGEWSALPVRLEPVAEVPEAIAAAARPGSGELYVAERSGRIWRLARSDGAEAGAPWHRDDQPVLDIRDEVSTGGERGLLGLAFSADGGTLYTSYTDDSGASVLEAVQMGERQADATTRRQVLQVAQPFANHNGGHVVRGPDDLLYWGLGDGGGAGDPEANGQDPSTLLASVLRLDPGGSGGEPYVVPPDNPFAAGGGPGAAEVWLWGVRNPWRFSFDRQTGDLWLADVGQNRFEEINLLSAADQRDGSGANLGWSEMEGFEPYEGGTEPPDHHPPLFAYGRDGGRCSITGGHVYRGRDLPELQGVYLYGDFCTGEIRGLQVTPEGLVEAPLGVSAEPGTLVSFAEDGEGELYVLELSGRVSQLRADGGTGTGGA